MSKPRAAIRPRLTLFERLTIVCYVANLVFCIALIVTKWSLTTSLSPWFDRGALLAVYVALAVLVAGLFNWHRSRRHIEAHAFEVCLSCRHPLTAGIETGICPECGTAFERGETRAAWMRHFHTVEAGDTEDHSGGS